MFKYYILTSKSIRNLHRQFETLRPSDCVVVINSQLEGYADAAIDYCNDFNIEYYVTESDGTPATGKNSVLDLFLASDNQYMVQVDGDDMITKFGRNLYRTVALRDDAPDVIALYNQLSLEAFRPNLWEDQYDSVTVKHDGWYIPRELFPAYPWDYSMDAHYSDFDPEERAKVYVEHFGHDPEKSLGWAKNRLKVNNILKKYGERSESMNRIVFISRKAAEHMRYDPELVIGEDTIQFFKLKKLAYEGKLNVRMRNERWAFSYVYMNDTASITNRIDSEGHQIVDYDWMYPFHDALNKMVPELPEDYSLPEFIDPRYEIKQK